MTLLTRMQSSKTDKFVYLFAKFLLYCCALNVEGFGPDYVIETIDEIQPRYVSWTQTRREADRHTGCGRRL